MLDRPNKNLESLLSVAQNLSRLPADYAKCQCCGTSWRSLIGRHFVAPANSKPAASYIKNPL